VTTDCNQFVFGFHAQKRREIRAQLMAERLAATVVLLQREVEERIGILRQFASRFTDYRNAGLIEHPVEELVAQRI